MARYDRIAPLSAPSRESAFPGWLVLRDIEGNDRDTEGARRARLRFLAVRPVVRLLDRGIGGVSKESYKAQIEAVREELGYLPARDVERARLARFLHQIEEREAARIIGATIEMADACAYAGQTYAAEEYALVARGLAARNNEDGFECNANIVVARIYRLRGEYESARAAAQAAASAAQRLSLRVEFINARGEEALVLAANGDARPTLAILNECLQVVRAARNLHLEGLVQARLCSCEAILGNSNAAIEHGWIAIKQLDDVRERARVLEDLGLSFARSGLNKAAERCFAILAQRGVDPALRARARAALAVSSAAAGAAAQFHSRRLALLQDAAEWSADPRVASLVHLELGRGCLSNGDVDYARDHLREAILIARRHSLADVLARAEEVLTAMEQNSAYHLAAAGSVPVSEAARRLADQMEAMGDLVVIAS